MSFFDRSKIEKYWEKYFDEEIEKEIETEFHYLFYLRYDQLKKGFDNTKNTIFGESVKLAQEEVYRIIEKQAIESGEKISIGIFQHRRMDNRVKFFERFLEDCLEEFLEDNFVKEFVYEITSDLAYDLRKTLMEKGEIDEEGDLINENKD